MRSKVVDLIFTSEAFTLKFLIYPSRHLLMRQKSESRQKKHVQEGEKKSSKYFILNLKFIIGSRWTNFFGDLWAKNFFGEEFFFLFILGVALEVDLTSIYLNLIYLLLKLSFRAINLWGGVKMESNNISDFMRWTNIEKFFCCCWERLRHFRFTEIGWKLRKVAENRQNS